MIYYVIPARKGSVRAPGKNRILFHYTAETVAKKPVIVSTDDCEIKRTAKWYGFSIHTRKQEHATETAEMGPVLLDVINENKIKDEDIIILLYLVHPDRKNEDIEKAIKYFLDNDCKSLVCKSKAKQNPSMMIGADDKPIINHNKYRTQDFPEAFFISHYVAIYRAGEVKNLNQLLINENTKYFLLEKEIVDINTAAELSEWLERRGVSCM